MVDREVGNVVEGELCGRFESEDEWGGSVKTLLMLLLFGGVWMMVTQTTAVIGAESSEFAHTDESW